MKPPFWRGDSSRKVLSRIVVEGDLVLQTPCSLGSGDTDDMLDLPLLLDPLTGNRPLLTGATLAGALRAWLARWEGGYSSSGGELTTALFGAERGGAETPQQERNRPQSALIVEDALGDQVSGVEFRSGVRLNPESRTAADKALYDMQLWPAGTTFPIRLELLVPEEQRPKTFSEDDLKKALATALHGLECGALTLGARKRRGLGQVKVSGWKVRRYDLTSLEDLIDWLVAGAAPLSPSDAKVVGKASIAEALGVEALLEDRRKYFRIQL
ncbi:MAG: RAMP superfamily CRISPR-associated protein, partial [Gammaproteobacteria bacterium]